MIERYRVSAILETLRSLPDPTYDGEVLKIPVARSFLKYELYSNQKPEKLVESCIVLVANVHGWGKDRWLEWELEIG